MKKYYLDRDGLGASFYFIEEFKGGVVIISCNREFANAVAQEKWIMEKGHLRREGESTANQEDDSNTGNPKIKDTLFDAAKREMKLRLIP